MEKNLAFTEGLYILAAARMAGERTPQAIVHLLRGRKNNQAIADAALFDLSMLYGLFQQRSPESIQNELNRLVDDGLLAVRSHGERLSVYVSALGDVRLTQLEEEFGYAACLASVSSVFERTRAVRFWQRTALLVQTISQLVYEEPHFYPIVEERGMQQDVKQVLLSHPDRLELSVQVKRELFCWMERLAEWERELLLRRLSGKPRAGWTYAQLAARLDLADGAAALHLIRLAAEQVSVCSPAAFPVLSRFVEAPDDGLSQSARQTKRLLQEGRTVEEIIQLRRLKRGTVEDHIVEIVLADPAFPVSSLVKADKLARIHAFVAETGTRKISDIRRALGEAYSYLDIRLACARLPKQEE
ncbi:uncharacterized protein YpbB [Aneurinibacillus soli]|uniref:Uncharacterized protein n=1 Tax=Aneurinibacillus soli TaxID=1500254 RepID=A0A0U5BF85_9BACL|nr:helix-turn-helix domain-containing protein [Aneurinibacillus soli]PYE63006.1 uncharacterized protein YpbB [Aneurinibacillus soli]BAU28935.1 hypothetical protein CB4_03112 [Aneurinibacillus soli]